MSIVRVGMSEDSKFSDGWDAIFGGGTKKEAPAKKPQAKAAKKPAPKKSAAKKK